MGILTQGTQTFLLVNGLSVNRRISLGPGVEILPARCDTNPDAIIKVSKTEVDLGIAAIFLRRVSSQIHITSDDPKNLGALAWNTLWDVILLSAIFNCNATTNLQSNGPAESFGFDTSLNVVHYHLQSLGSLEERALSEQESDWLESHFQTARNLLCDSNFTNAVHSMASFRWHPHPRAKLAILWSGIEGLFGIESELSFRVSLYCARFLSQADEEERKSIFSSVRRLYKLRSSAVHGQDLGTNTDSGVNESATLLQTLIKRCIEKNQVPKADELAP